MTVPENLLTKPGWCTKEKSEILYNLIIESKSILTVEIGVYGGRSLIPMALAHKKNKIGKIIGIDAWDSSASVENYDITDENYNWWLELDHWSILCDFVKSLYEYDVKSVTDYYISKSLELVNFFDEYSVDILHQDGNHSELITLKEVELYSPKIKVGGYWIMNDTNWETLNKAQNLILTKGFNIYQDHQTWKIFKKVF